jgi:hypothetical protein
LAAKNTAELFRSLITRKKARQLAKPRAVAAGQNDCPAISSTQSHDCAPSKLIK